MSAIDLTKLPPPAVVETLDFETLYAEAAAELARLWPEFNPAQESSLPAKVLQAIVYVAVNLRARINDAARAVLLAQALGADLDNLGALLGVLRLVVKPADPDHGVPDPVMEEDDDFRERITLAPSSFSVAGPEAAYVFHARSASGAVLDASATSPEPDDIKALVMQVLARNAAPAALVDDMQATLDAASWPGQVFVSVLARDDDGQAPPDLLDTVANAVSAENVRPLTDFVTVQSAEIVRYQVHAKLWTYAGPDSDVVRANARAALDSYVAASRRLGRDVTLSGLYAALQQPGVQNVELLEPSANIVVSASQATFCEGITIEYEGIGE